MLIARLIADSATLKPRLDAAVRALACEGMDIELPPALGRGAEVGELIELALPDGPPERLRSVLDAHCQPCDALFTTRALGTPALFVSDMDSTIIAQECIDELADYAGQRERCAVITERAMRGEIDFEAALRERVALLAGIEEAAVDACIRERIRPSPGARQLVATLKAKGCRAVLVTGGFHHFADAVAEQLGFDRVVGNRLAASAGKLNGELAGAVVDAEAKARVLREEQARLGEGALSLVTGDGANDIPMLRAADIGLAWRAKSAAREAADGWIERGDLTAALTLLGIAESEWAAG
ncbi:phosphoserine phosphatase SerB [Haliangium ochraceum]|uniref:Phosphoserine phosphatase n=1 Tax=Haliangium ochraceum (strain DSM 14365 / JCM 11303 / SMP-2) TaxID=502025 RepID=D0LTV0_HALO1|nr:phosphoserine phosphatase SerB [Haliangium ochraceum]ACY15794.1 phosphoserine phosphatase SerB [Haliangium ochraceum DSM 14365]